MAMFGLSTTIRVETIGRWSRDEPSQHARHYDCGAIRSRNAVRLRSPPHTLLNPANATATAQGSVPLNILASGAMRAKIASHITISARLFAGSIVLVSQPPPDPPRRHVAIRTARDMKSVRIR